MPCDVMLLKASAIRCRAITRTGHSQNIFCCRWIEPSGEGWQIKPDACLRAHPSGWAPAPPHNTVRAATTQTPQRRKTSKHLHFRCLPCAHYKRRGLLPLGFNRYIEPRACAYPFAMPTGDSLVASCSGDGTVRLTDLNHGTTRIVFQHEERAKKLATVRGNPNLIMSCSEDGTSEGARVVWGALVAWPGPRRGGVWLEGPVGRCSDNICWGREILLLFSYGWQLLRSVASACWSNGCWSKRRFMPF